MPKLRVIARLEGHIVRFVRYKGRGGMPKIPLSVLCNSFEGKFASLGYFVNFELGKNLNIPDRNYD